MTKLTLRALGGFELRRGGGEVVELREMKAKALFVYLALNPRTLQTREHLANLLWGERFNSQARASLRGSLSTLLGALGDEADVIVKEGQALRLDPSRIDIDVAELETLATADEAALVERGVGLYGGDLLDGFSVPAEEFELWLDDQRQRLRAIAVEALLRLSALHEAAGDDAALTDAKRAVEIDPLREDACRRLMRLLDSAGRRTEALRQYTACEQALRRQLDIVPEAETVRLAEEIRARTDSPAEALVASPTGLRAWLRKPRNPITAASLIVVGLAAGIYGTNEYINARERIRADRLEFSIPEKPSIVVLPFRNLSPEHTRQQVVAGITEGITNALSIVSGMFVISRHTALTFIDSGLGAREIAEQLGVRYVLDGSVQEDDGRVRVTVELIDNVEGYQDWADSFESEITDVFSLQDKITLDILVELQVELAEGEQGRISRTHGTDNLRAWILANQAMQRLRRFTAQDNTTARDLYKQAIAIDPNYSGAIAGIGWTHLLDAFFAWSESRQASVRMAGERAQRAMELDPDRPSNFALLGQLQLLAGNHQQAVALGEKAVELAPSAADVTALLALTLTYTGDYDRSTVLSKAAMRLSPMYSDWYRWVLGRAYRLQGNTGEAEKVLIVETAGNDISQARLAELAATYAGMGRWRAARQTGRKLLALQPAFSATAWAHMPPHVDPEQARLDLAALLRAGLPE